MELNSIVVFTLRKKTPVAIKRQPGWRAQASGHVLEDEHLMYVVQCLKPCNTLYMFRALLCLLSGGQNCIIQHLVSSHL